MLSRSLFLTLGISVLLPHLGCVSASSPEMVAMLRYTVEVRTTSGELLANTRFRIDTKYPYGTSKRETRIDSEGRLEVTEIRERDPSNAFRLRAPVPGSIGLQVQFPEVHPTRKYEVNVVLDREDPRWNDIERDGVLEPPLQVEAAPGPENRSYLYRHGATYFATGDYKSATVLADGTDTRRVPFNGKPPIGAAPGEPRLEVRVRATPLEGERGHRLHIWLIAPDPVDRDAERSELLKSLRGHLERVKAGQTAEESDLDRLDLAWLTESSREEILEALDEPDYCVKSRNRGRDAYGFDFPTVPCDQGDADFVYRLYHVPPGSQGVGQELRLVFGEEGACTSQVWDFTRLSQ